MSIQPTARRAHSFRGIAALALLVPIAALAQATSAPAPAAPAATSATPANTRPAGSVRAAQALPAPVALPGVSKPTGTASRPGADARTGPSPDELFASWDKDRNKSLSLEEFRAGIEQGRQASLVARLGALFRTADVNHNGKLEAPEYASLPLIKRAGAEAPTLSAFDANKDGALDSKEYMQMIGQLVRTAETQGGN